MTQDTQLAVIDQGGAVVSWQPGRIDEHPAVIYLASLSERSRRTMGGDLTRIARILAGDAAGEGRAAVTWQDVAWHHLRYQHAVAIRTKLAERYAHSTANRMLSALRGVLKAAWRLGLMSAEDYHMAASVPAVKGETVPAGRHVPAGEVLALLATCDQSELGIRDAAVISLLYGAGLRRAELVGLNLADYDQAAGELKVRGKGNKQRVLPVVNGTAAALGDWLAVRGDAPGPLFVGMGKRQRGGRLTTQAIYYMLTERAKAAGIPSLSPHDFRRTFVGELLERGADIATVQQLAGHANVTTTARYDRRGEKVKRAAAELLHVPYQRRTLTNGRQ